MPVCKNVLLPFAQPPFTHCVERTYQNLTCVFADLAKKYGLKVFTDQELIADLFDVRLADLWSENYCDMITQERGTENLLVTVEIDEQEDDERSWEERLHDALMSFHFLSENDLNTGIYADIVVDMTKFEGVATTRSEVVDILRQAFQKRIDEVKELRWTTAKVYDTSGQEVCIFKGADEQEVTAVAKADYPQQEF